MRNKTTRLALAGLILASLTAAPPAAAQPARPAGETAAPAGPKPPADDKRLPDREIKSPGFPSEMAGKCRTMQDCAAYCKAHPSEPPCPGQQRKAAP